ncbi:MAG: 16S rRNA (uracil(1498)-N(3))-methyltransferase [Planctomycetia bacterium]|nr:16S rRNA (uracil(1498)-N(3))-methyltransferase [Planctomycetia bacterium]
MTQRYYVETPITGDEASVVDAEAHHLAHVMRVKVGAEVTLFDGSGFEFLAEVTKVGRSEVRLAIRSRAVVDRELRREITLASALPRGDRQKWLIEKGTELGVRRFVPLRTQRAVVQPDDGACTRLRRAVVEASKQCRRNVLMEIAPAADVATFVTAADRSALRVLGKPESARSLTELARAPLSVSTKIVLLVGPEGGFTEEEEAAALSAGWEGINLGPRILRIETAAALLCGWAALTEPS